jgi:hypothetical protein
MESFPNKIVFLSDSTEAEFVNEIIGAKVKERIANYVYTKSITNLDMVFSMFLNQIDNLHKSGLIVCQ